MPGFSLTRNGKAIYEAALEGTELSQVATNITVNELQAYGIEIIDRESETEYAIWIGDIEAGQAIRTDGRLASTIGFGRGTFIIWDDARYFEGARGNVWVRVCSRLISQDRWRDRVKYSVIVTSSKLSEDRYFTMIKQMSGLASGLILDLVSKMTRSLNAISDFSHPVVRSSVVELRLLETTWPKIAACLQQIEHEPATILRQNQVLGQCWGSEQIDSRAIVSMARQGIDLSPQNLQIPFKAQVKRTHEDYHTAEHQIILGFIKLLLNRARDCESDLLRHIESIEADQVWRDRSLSNSMSLYVQEDVPRLKQLQGRLTQTRILIQQLHQASQIYFLKGVLPRYSLETTPTFASVEPYRRLRFEILKLLRYGSIILDEGVEERIKSTSKLYEQWVFLQILGAMRLVGLECLSQQSVLHSTRRFRFTLDIDRGACVVFSDENGRCLKVRYEPWVMPYFQALENMESVYRGTAGASAWSPDILIEFVGDSEQSTESVSVDYAVVIDAKYTTTIRDHHWDDTSKYLQIRSTTSKKQIVRQQWLAYSGDEKSESDPIEVQDSSIKWTGNGPSCSMDDHFVASLRLTPPDMSGREVTAEGWIVEPEKPIIQFVQGLVAFLGLECRVENDVSD